jgi:D-threo-aldose 1-dehydrogenase
MWAEVSLRGPDNEAPHKAQSMKKDSAGPGDFSPRTRDHYAEVTLQQIKLPGIDFPVSRLGYGTSMLMSRLNQKQSERLLGVAMDAGITHFDTARLYGYGEAEAALGAAIAGCRDKVTVTTKVGILPPKNTRLLSAAKLVARKAAAAVPQLRTRLRRRADAMTQGGVFDIPTITLSLETSLRKLRTDYVDFLLLHECGIADLEKPELLDFLKTAKRQGRIRRFGIAATADVTKWALVNRPEFTPVIQFPNSAFEPVIECLDLQKDPAIFTHSSLSLGFGQLCSELTANSIWSDSWSRRLGLDCHDRSTLGRLALHCALSLNPQGVVLFASASEANIRANASAVESLASARQIEIFRDLVNEMQSRRIGVAQ